MSTIIEPVARRRAPRRYPRSLAVLRAGSRWRWYCRACGHRQPPALPPFRTEDVCVESWMRHASGPDHRAAVGAENVARIVYRIAVERRL